MEYKCGMGKAYIEQIKNGENKDKYGVFHTSKPYKESTRKDLLPTQTQEEAQAKLDKYAKEHNLKQVL